MNSDELFDDAKKWARAKGADRTDFEGVYLLAAKKLAQDLELALLAIEVTKLPAIRVPKVPTVTTEWLEENGLHDMARRCSRIQAELKEGGPVTVYPLVEVAE